MRPLKSVKLFFVFLASLAVLNLSVVAFADAPKCNGPAELCKQLDELNSQVAKMEKADGDSKMMAAKEEQKKEDEGNALQAMAMALAIAAGLKLFLSSLKSYKGYFKTSKAKAWRKVITLTVGFAAFVATSVGMGLPWWQALIVAGGGPGAMILHDMMKLTDVIRGKKKYREIKDDLQSDLGGTSTPPEDKKA